MNSPRSGHALLAGIAVAMLSVTVNADGVMPDLPIVPASTVTQDVPPPVQASPTKGNVSSSSNSGALPAGLNVSSESNIEVKPGVTQIAAISRGHLNRIVTPFPSPEVMTSSLQAGSGDQCGEVCIKDNVIYVTTDSQRPVTMSINEEGRQDAAIMMTLVPKDVPPRELTLSLGDSMMAGLSFGSKKAESWEESQPYVTTLTNLFRQIALGEVPQGYTLHTANSGILPVCYQEGVSYSFVDGQRMLGHHFEVAIGVATNTGSGPIEIRETACGSQNVAAVAAWPRNVLQPGDKTEVYVATTKSSGGGKPTTQRPSLVR
jgi:conjugal transfer pilus assembly protein TraK